MKIVERKVYYCEFCNRHRMAAHAILNHEPKCIYNPNRTWCGWHDNKRSLDDIPAIAQDYKTTLDLDWLRQIAGGCPACMLAVYVQAQLTDHEKFDAGFDYQGEVNRFRKEENREYESF